MFYGRRLRIKQTKYASSDDVLSEVETIGKCILINISIYDLKKTEAYKDRNFGDIAIKIRTTVRTI